MNHSGLSNDEALKGPAKRPLIKYFVRLRHQTKFPRVHQKLFMRDAIPIKGTILDIFPARSVSMDLR